jgi:type I restriction enzyme S subunit
MMKDEFSSIGEIAKILKGSKAPEVFDKPRPGAYPYLQIEDLRPDATPKYAIDKDGTLATKTDVLIAWDGANAGTVGFDLEGYIGSTIAILRPTRNDIHAPYLGYFLRSKFNEIQENATGATIPHVSRSYLENLKLPIPPLTEQKRIASLLARADRLRQLRRTAHDLGDALLQSVFLEMFGDPVTNSKKLNVEKLEGFTSLVSSGSTPLGGSNVYTASGIRFIRSQNVLMNKFDFSDIAFISEEIYNSMKRTFVKRNDVLLNITGASIGRVACYQDDILANVNQHVCIIRCKPEKLNPIYLSFFLSMPSFQEKFITNQSGATRQALNFEQIKDFNISVPTLNLQEEFAGVVARVESLRGRMGESARQVEGLFESLLAEAFDGKT